VRFDKNSSTGYLVSDKNVTYERSNYIEFTANRRNRAKLTSPVMSDSEGNATFQSLTNGALRYATDANDLAGLTETDFRAE